MKTVQKNHIMPHVCNEHQKVKHTHQKKTKHSNRSTRKRKKFLFGIFLVHFYFLLVKSKFFNDMTWFLWEFDFNTKEFLFLVKIKKYNNKKWRMVFEYPTMYKKTPKTTNLMDLKSFSTRVAQSTPTLCFNFIEASKNRN